MGRCVNISQVTESPKSLNHPLHITQKHLLTFLPYYINSCPLLNYSYIDTKIGNYTLLLQTVTWLYVLPTTHTIYYSSFLEEGKYDVEESSGSRLILILILSRVIVVGFVYIDIDL
jgi:hypothetical protein